jgi:hypothetical protein
MIVFKDRADEVFHEGMERGIHKLVESGSRRRLIKAFTRGAMVGYYFASDLCESPVERIFLAAAVWSLHRKDSLLLVLPPSCVRPLSTLSSCRNIPSAVIVLISQFTQGLSGSSLKSTAMTSTKEPRSRRQEANDEPEICSLVDGVCFRSPAPTFGMTRSAAATI